MNEITTDALQKWFNELGKEYKQETLLTVISVLRSIIVNTAVILILPRLFGAESAWITFSI